MRVLRKGTIGQDVRKVQTFLTPLKFYTGEVDGKFFRETELAVERYQENRNLKIDGWVGKFTYAAMIAEGLDVVLDAAEEWPPAPDWLKPLTNNELRMRRWGRFDYRPAPSKGNPEGIEILGGWEEKNIVTIECPVFKKKVRLHKDVVADYVGFMKAVIEAGLAHLLLTHDGGHNARFIRGSRITLSNHAWGTAFDVNYEWNQLGVTPAYRGQKGSVRELVQLANKWNWYWGGHFKFRRDGMHFEHV